MKNQIEAVIRLHKKDNPIMSYHLEERFNLAGSEIRNIIRELRRQGKPIANCPSGYYWAETYREIEDTINDLEGRAFSMLETSKALKNTFKENQLTIF